MRGMKIMSVGLLAVLLISVVAIRPALAAADPNEIVITDVTDYTKIQTDDYTVIFPRNGTKPMFIWWENNQSEKIYVVHFKGLIEYATIDGGDFSLFNLSESTLFTNLVKHMNQVDRQILKGADKVGADILKASDAILAAMLEQGLGKDKKGVVAKLETALILIQGLNETITDEGLQDAIDDAADAMEDAIEAVEAGGNPGQALNDAKKAVADVLKAAIDRLKEIVQERVEARERLLEKAEDFHPAILPFSAANWTISDILPIVAGSDIIGYNFTMDLTEAPKKFEFAENNISIAIRIYNTTVVENYEHYGNTITYNVTDGEMKMDLIINNWTWNFEPKTIDLLDSENITISPALALWVDASCFNASGTRVEKYFTDLDDMESQSLVSNASFSSDDTRQVIQMNDQENDAKAIKFKPTIKNVKIAGKSFGMASAAQITFNNETLGGFFEFVPYALRVNTTANTSEVVPISASYFVHGNHLRVYIKYPYFNETLIHDPSIGMQQADTQSPSYIVDVGQSGVASIQALPAFLAYPTLMGAAIAAVLAFAGAVLFIAFARRHPTFMGR